MGMIIKFLKTLTKDYVEVSADDPLPVQTASIERVVAFSTTTTLGNAGVYTSPSIEFMSYKSGFLRSFSDVGGGYIIQYSDDEISWDPLANNTTTANTTATGTINPWGKYFRIVYTNGATPQTVFRLTVTLSPL